MTDLGTLAAIARDLGAHEVRERSGKVTCSCLLARWTHFGGYDTKPSMVIFPHGRYGEPIYKCMGCHEEGPLRDLVLEHWAVTGRNLMHWVMAIDGDGDGVPVKARERLRAIPDEPGFKKRKGHVQQDIVKRFEDGKPFYDYRSIAEADAVQEIPAEVYEPYRGSIPRYALDRGLTVETCKAWDLGHDKEGRRLLFPIRDHKGRLVAISGRLYSLTCVYCDGPIVRGKRDHEGKRIRDYCGDCRRNEPPKYLHTDGFKRNLVLFGEHRKEDNIDGNVFVVEGHLDMVMLWQAGYRPVVAMLGSYPGRCQIEKLIAYWGRRITLIPDGDKAGVDMVAKVKQLVADRVPVVAKKLPDQTDAAALLLANQRGELPTDELHKILGEPTVRPVA